MQHLNSFLLLALCCLFGSSLLAQDGLRYVDDVFEDTIWTPNLQYAENATILTIGVPGVEAPTIRPLLFDFFEPAGDTASARPLVILVHSGNFLPIGVNQSTTGNRLDSVNVEVAYRLARKGYAVASIDYRLGWNPNAEDQDERVLSLIQAAYRGIQDARTAIRFFRRDFEENDNSFRIDTSRIVLWGIGTGGYISLGSTVLDDYSNIANTTNPPGKFTIPNPLPEGPDRIPMILEALNGDIFGRGFPNPEDTVIVRPPLDQPPLEEGDILNVPNHIDFSSDFHLTVNMGGAMADISWLEADHVPIITYHVPTDPFAPYEDAVLVVPTTGDPVVQVQGGVVVAERGNNLGINSPFLNVESEFADRDQLMMITQRARDASAEANGASGPHDYYEGLFPLIRTTNELDQEEGSPWNWWDAERWDAVPSANDPDISLHELNLLNNADMSKEKAMLYIDTIMWYFTPRAYMALNLASSSTEELLDAEQVSLKVTPNPATDRLFLTSGEGYPMREVLVFDLNGRLVQAHSRLEAFQFELPRQGLPPGMYVIRVGFDEGVAAKKVLFR